MPAPSADHATLLTIDLAAIAANWRLLADRVAPAECAAAVKADAYGLGVERVAPALAAAGCASFFVAHLSEARRLRRALPSARIHVLNGLPPGSAPAYLTDNLQPVLGSRAEIAEWLGATGNASAAPAATLHLDTGMNRLGLPPADLAEAKAMLDARAGARIGLLMSHFAASEVAEDPLNARQIEALKQARLLLPNIKVSLCNSSGIFLKSMPYFDLVRPGYALFGGNPTPGANNPMRPVVTLEAPIIATREIAAGESVGYNATWTARRATRLATVSLGYGDGWPRVGGEGRPGGVALIGGVRCPIAGRVSMDLIVLDVTDAPASLARRGASATFLGAGLGIDEVAERAGTIGYPILTSLGDRFERRYV